MDKTPVPANNESPQRKTHPPGADLGIAAGIAIWGMMLNYFPIYANIPPGWALIFIIPGYICYVVGFLGAAIGLGAIFKSEFIFPAGIGTFLLVSAYLLHRSTGSSVSAGWTCLLLMKLGVLILAGLGIMFLLASAPLLFHKVEGQPRDNQTSSESTSGTTQSGHTTAKSKSEQVISLIVAILTLLAALAPILRDLLPQTPPP